MSKVFVCPVPLVWDKIYRRLEQEWKKHRIQSAGPPVPLILAGWVFSSDIMKHDRWNQTIQWAKENGLSDLIPQLHEQDCYQVVEMSTSVSEWWTDMEQE